VLERGCSEREPVSKDLNKVKVSHMEELRDQPSGKKRQESIDPEQKGQVFKDSGQATEAIAV
jgi:hypothetical protein